ncbi:glycosyl hydrolase [Flavobacterium sp.]|uniref:glycosyl hydrolase n=1 Tax=Flavobacterium sp. TaxID=239 RepID=UPI00286E2162|nr:glycosyl hydrolase [Flavobacterium sp.]
MKNFAKYFIVLLTLSGTTLFAQNTVLVENQKLTIANLGGDNYTIGSNAALRITTPLTANGKVNLISDSGWLILDGVLPSRALILHLGYITVNGQKAVNNVNVRITNYLRGCVIMPHTPSYEALSLFKDISFAGDEMKCIPYKYYKIAELGSFDNEVSSFKLKKGYMATFAQNENGTGYSKVFIADGQDIQVSTLQAGLNNQVSFVRVFPWRYTEKKGMGWSIKSPIQSLRGSWFYNWGPATAEGLLDIEYVPMKWTAWNASDSQWQTILNNNTSNHLLGFNEPDAATQANMSLDLMLLRWPKMMESGMRLGSPCPAGNKQLLYDFIKKCDELNYRVDFVTLHDYGEGTAQQFYNNCKTLHDKTGRPVWVTEFNYGGTWTSGKPTYAQSAARIKEIIERYDKEGIIERYAIFNFDEVDQNRAVFYNPVEDLKITPLGVAYRDQTSVMAFNPLEQIDIPFKMVAPVSFKGTNTDGITTKLIWQNFIDNSLGTFKIERSFNGGVFTQVATVSGTNNSYNDIVGDIGYGIYTYKITAINAFMGNSATVSATVDVNLSGKQNVARFKNVEVNSTNSASFPGKNAVDANVVSDASRWVSKAGVFPAILEIDLVDYYLVDELALYCGYAGYNSPITNFQFQIWDGKKWVDVITETANTQALYKKNFTEVKTNKLRLYVNAIEGNVVRLFEIEVYGNEFNTLSTPKINSYKHQFKIYPNPTSSFINIEGNDDVESIVVFDLNAKVLMRTQGSKSIDVSQLSAGTYVVSVNDKETFKFIKK